VVRYYKGEFRDERTEFERITRQFVGNDPQAVQDQLRYLEGLFYNARPQKLRDSMWRNLQNTSSWEVKTVDSIFRNLRRDGVRRNISRIANQFIGEGMINGFNGRVECPIILHSTDQTGNEYQLVAGNTRLSMARALNQTPEVIILETDW
jgi:hypothetical protein|tara:strand:+ start:327 stop:776 length:450 start_codon:yes stop_codon:yes gene_type:complete